MNQNTNPVEKTTGKLLYTARRSAWHYKGACAIAALLVLVGILLAIIFFVGGSLAGLVGLALIAVGVVVIVLSVLVAHAYRIEIYDDHILVHEGLLNVRERRSILTPIVGTSVSQSLWGRFFHYGDVKIDKQGSGWDISTDDISKPEEFKRFLESLMNSTDYSSIHYVMNN